MWSFAFQKSAIWKSKVGFNFENVLQSLEITEVVEAETEKPKYEISFEGILGVSARFYCEQISIESVEPYVP